MLSDGQMEVTHSDETTLFLLILGGAGEVEGAGGRRAQSAAERQREPSGKTPVAPGAAAAGGFPDAQHGAST